MLCFLQLCYILPCRIRQKYEASKKLGLTEASSLSSYIKSLKPSSNEEAIALELAACVDIDSYYNINIDKFRELKTLKALHKYYVKLTDEVKALEYKLRAAHHACDEACDDYSEEIEND